MADMGTNNSVSDHSAFSGSKSLSSKRCRLFYQHTCQRTHSLAGFCYTHRKELVRILFRGTIPI